MTTAAEPLHLRPPVWARAWIVAFLPVWLWVFPTGDRGVSGSTVLGVLVAGLAVGFAARLFVMAAVGTPDGRLTVRNHWSTRTFERGEVTGAEVDRVGGRLGGEWGVWLRLADGSRHLLDVTRVPFRGLSAGRLERDLAAVCTWLGAPA